MKLYSLILGYLLLNLIQTASASLIISPTRVVFEGKDRTQPVYLLNSGNETKTYRLSWVEKEQTANGDYKTLQDKSRDHLLFPKASDYLRYSPRQITLGPGERQRVRLSLRQAASGIEKRSYLSIAELPAADEIQTKQEAAKIQIYTLMNFAIPVLVRPQMPQVQAQINQVELIKVLDRKAVSWAIQFDLNRQGANSIFGEAEVYWKAPNSSQFQYLTRLKNIAVYRERAKIKTRLGLKAEQVKAGIYRIIYTPDVKEFPNLSPIQTQVTLDPAQAKTFKLNQL